MQDKQTDANFNSDPVYICTAIAYTNGPPHVGHAYEFITADTFARYNRACGRDTFFVSGTDEHGQKVQTSAEACGRTPQEHCDYYAGIFKDIMEKLSVDIDVFVRTSHPHHHETVQKIWNATMENGDIYKGVYEGWYDVRAENFVKESDAALTDYKDPETGKPYEKKVEETYFFRLSKYTDAIKKWLERPGSLRPEIYRQEILAFVESGLEDLCVSRTSFNWGVPVPNDPEHVMYVWYDALNNYLTSLGQKDQTDLYKKHWTSKRGHRNAVIIGKDIVRFHAVIWTAILTSAGIPTDDYHLLTHGFVSAADGAKMSKSVGNVVDPIAVLDECGADALRHYFCSAAAYGGDLKFSVEQLKDQNNGVLADVIGNLFNRAANLTKKICGGVVPEDSITEMVEANDTPFNIAELVHACDEAMKEFKLELYCELIAAAGRSANKWLADKAPWKLDDEIEKRKIIRLINEACWVLWQFFQATCPVAMKKYSEKTYPAALVEMASIGDLNEYDNLPVGTPIQIPGVVFAKIIDKADVPAKMTFEEAKAAKKAKQEARAKQQAAAKAAKATK